MSYRNPPKSEKEVNGTPARLSNRNQLQKVIVYQKKTLSIL